MITAPGTDTPEMQALLTLAEKYNDQFEKLLEAARRPSRPSVDRLDRQNIQVGPVEGVDGTFISDTEGVPLQRDDRVILRDGVPAKVLRIDRRTRRIVAKRDDDGRIVAAVAHLTTKINPPKQRKKDRRRH